MKACVRRGLAVCLLLLCLSLGSCGLEDAKYTEIESPLFKVYPSMPSARSPHDMILWEGRLYVGAGDYSANTGPIGLWCYEPTGGEWQYEGTVPDEAITRFAILGGTLTAPGTDPTGEWELGNYYVRNGDSWQTLSTIPGGIHNFDMAEYDGKLFAGLGVEAGHFPIACSEDNGQSFYPVEMRRNGIAIETNGNFSRVYDLFLHGGKLYAAFFQQNQGADPTYELYRYENGIFVFDNQWYGKLANLTFTSGIVAAKAEFKGRTFFTTGYLYVTADMNSLTQVQFPKNELIADLIVAGDALYVLGSEAQAEGSYRISVWKNESGADTGFRKVVTLPYDAQPLSLAYDGEAFYVGIGNVYAPTEKSGTILRIPYKS